jgi:hypothetical protein
MCKFALVSKMMRSSRLSTYGWIATLASLAGTGCTTAPLYEVPDSVREKAYLTFEYTENNFSLNPLVIGKPFAPSSVAKVSRLEGEFICGKPLPNPQTMFIRSHGNPLVSNINMDGIWIAAGRRFMFYAMSLPGPSHMCGVTASFTPRMGAKYALRLDQSEGRGCSAEVIEMSAENASKEESSAVADFQLESCKPSAT